MTETLVLEHGGFILARELETKEFTVVYRNRGPGYRHERIIPYENLLLEQAAVITKLEAVSFLIGFTFTLLALAIGFGDATRNGINWWAFIVFGAIAAAGWYVCWHRSGYTLRIPVIEQAHLELSYSGQHKRMVDGFLERLAQHVKTYARNKFGPVGHVMPRDEQLRRLSWLRERNFLTNAEYDTLVAQIPKSAYDGPQREVGF